MYTPDLHFNTVKFIIGYIYWGPAAVSDPTTAGTLPDLIVSGTLTDGTTIKLSIPPS